MARERLQPAPATRCAHIPLAPCRSDPPCVLGRCHCRLRSPSGQCPTTGFDLQIQPSAHPDLPTRRTRPRPDPDLEPVHRSRVLPGFALARNCVGTRPPDLRPLARSRRVRPARPLVPRVGRSGGDHHVVGPLDRDLVVAWLPGLVRLRDGDRLGRGGRSGRTKPTRHRAPEGGFSCPVDPVDDRLRAAPHRLHTPGWATWLGELLLRRTGHRKDHALRPDRGAHRPPGNVRRRHGHLSSALLPPDAVARTNFLRALPLARNRSRLRLPGTRNRAVHRPLLDRPGGHPAG